MKTAILLFILTSLLWVSGCGSHPVTRSDYQARANDKMEAPPRKETETADQKRERETKERALGRPIGVLSVRDEFLPPKLVKLVEPAYPDSARRRNISGFVKVGIVITESGSVDTAVVVESSDPAFEQPALDAVRQWRFTPAKKNGQAIRMSFTVPVAFEL